MKLKSEATQQILLSDLEVARSIWRRGIGLMGKASMGPEQGLLILRGNWIHTHFMKFAIDCVFVDDQMVVQALRENVRPWRFLTPVWKASHVIEMPAGNIRRLKISTGEKLHVGD